MKHRDAAIGESFHVVSPAALTFRGYAEGMAAWYGVEAHLEFFPYDEWRVGISDRDAAVTLDHLRHSPNCSIAKARCSIELRAPLQLARGGSGCAAIQPSLYQKSPESLEVFLLSAAITLPYTSDDRRRQLHGCLRFPTTL